MSRLEILERKIQSLNQEELQEFERWFAEYKADLWDKQIEEDATAGRIDKPADEAIRQFKTGNYKKI